MSEDRFNQPQPDLNTEGQPSCNFGEGIFGAQNHSFNTQQYPYSGLAPAAPANANQPQMQILPSTPEKPKSHTGAIVTLSVIAVCLAVILGGLLYLYNSGALPFGESISDSDENSDEQTYKSAIKLMEKGRYEDALKKFESLDGYKKSEEMIEQCRKQISTEVQNALSKKIYDNAIALKNEGKYDEAIAQFEKIPDYTDAQAQISACEEAKKEQIYTQAASLTDQKKYQEARDLFVSLGEFRDSSSKAEELRYICSILDARVGDYITFGKYEQDNLTTNGKEELEWIVLERRGTRLLVTTRYGIDCQKYHNSMTEVSWADCSLRSWLNSSFLDSAFSSIERAMIPTVTVSIEKHPNSTKEYTHTVQDKVFLLSISEALRYFSSDDARACTPTAYASAQGACHSSVTKNAWYWLRSSGHYLDYSAGVSFDGSVYNKGNPVNYTDDSVRPAMWIDYTAYQS